MALATVDMEVGWPEGILAHADYQFTDVWVMNDGAWRVISRFSESGTQRTPLEALRRRIVDR